MIPVIEGGESVEQHMIAMIAKGASRLGLAPSHPAIAEAINVGITALHDGREFDEAYEFARQVMSKASRPVAA